MSLPQSYWLAIQDLRWLSSPLGLLATDANQLVVRAPRPGEPWHAFVVGKKTDSVRKKFARESQWAVPPSGI